MNYNTYPTTAPSSEIVNDEREQEYRKELSESIVAESIGTVGVYMSLDLDNADKASLKQTIANRNPEGSNNEISVGGGWGDWGERRLASTQQERALQNSPNDKLLRPVTMKQEDREELAFIEMPDDTVELRYRYAAPGYKDGTGRPGNVLNVGFTLSQEKASELRQAVEADPNYIDDIIKAQVLAVGMSEKHWGRYIKPNDSFRAAKEDVLAITHASVSGDAQTERFAYADKKAIAPTYEQSVAVEAEPSVAVDEEALGRLWMETYEDTLRSAEAYVQALRERNWTDAAIRADLQELLATAEEDKLEGEANEESDPENATRSNADCAGYQVTLTKFEEELAAKAQQTELAQAQHHQVENAQSEVMSAFAAETTPTYKMGDRLTVGDEEMTIVDTYSMQNSEQTPMVVVQNAAGGQKHIKVASIKV
jgi:hypothetical protein